MKPQAKTAVGAILAGCLVLCLVGCADSPRKAVDRFLDRVPAETPYVFANLRPVPNAVIEKWLPLYRDAVAWYRERLAREARSAPGGEAASVRAVLDGLLGELHGHLTPEGLERLGLRLDGRSLVYGEGLLPVGRHEVADAARVWAFIERLEARIGERATRARFGGVEYLRMPMGDVAFVLGVTGGELVWGLVPAGEENARLPLLFGDERPPRSLAETEAFGRLLARERLPGYGDGYVDLRQLFAVAESSGQPALLDAGCKELVERFLEAVPRLVFGTTEASAERLSTRFLVETDEAVGQYLAALGYPIPGLGRASEAILAFGVGIDVPRLRAALRTLLRYLATSGADCPWVDPAAIEAAMPKLELALGPLTAMFKGLYVELLGLEVTQPGRPPAVVRLRALAEVDDPRGVLAMAGMFNPDLARLEVPVDGTPTRVPQRLLPPGAPPLSVAIRNRSLVLAAGDDGDRLAADLLAALPLDPPPLLAITYDLSQMGSLLEQTAPEYLDRLAAESGQSREELRAELQRASRLYRAYGTISTQVSGSARGLRVDQSVALP